MTGFWISLLIGLGYTLAAAVVAVGLIALAVCVHILTAQARGWWLVGAGVLALALIATLMSGCAVAVSYHRSDRPPVAEHPPETPQAETSPDAGAL